MTAIHKNGGRKKSENYRLTSVVGSNGENYKERIGQPYGKKTNLVIDLLISNMVYFGSIMYGSMSIMLNDIFNRHVTINV